MFKKTEPIISFDRVTLRLSGMRCVEEYEIICQGGNSVVSEYMVYYTKEDERKLLKSAECATEKLIELFNACGVLRWDGFNGPNPRGVRDGWMFNLTAELNGRTIHASGSNNYPRHYREFKGSIDSILNGGKPK